jgi:hypothetical protein
VVHRQAGNCRRHHRVNRGGLVTFGALVAQPHVRLDFFIPPQRQKPPDIVGAVRRAHVEVAAVAAAAAAVGCRQNIGVPPVQLTVQGPGARQQHKRRDRRVVQPQPHERIHEWVF